MIKKSKHDPNSAEYSVALLEDMNHKFEILIEAVQPIPQIQKELREVREIVGDMQPKLDVTYEAIGSLFVQIEEIKNELALVKQALTLLGRDTSAIENLKLRVAQLEEQAKV